MSLRQPGRRQSRFTGSVQHGGNRALLSERRWQVLELISLNTDAAPGVWSAIRRLIEDHSVHPQVRKADVLVLHNAVYSWVAVKQPAIY